MLFSFIFNFSFGVVFYSLIGLNYDSKLFDRINGIRKFSETIKSDLGNNSIIVVSDRLLYSNLAYEYRDENIRLLIPLSPNQNITNHFQINSSLIKDSSENFIFLGSPSEISYLEKDFEVRFIKEYKPKFMSLPVRVYEVYF